MNRPFALAIFIAILCSPALAAQSTQSAQPDAAAQPQLSATPTFSQSPTQSYPRLAGLADQAIEAQVNKLLATRERADRASRTDCLRAYISHGKPSYSELIRLTYLSPRLLSIDVRTSSFCGSPYPNDNIPYPMTLDLTSGHELDWRHFFTNEFLNPPADKPSPLMDLYLRHAALDEDCTNAVNDPSTTFDFWLDSGHKALMARPSSLPHAVDVCAKLTLIPFTELQPYVRDPLIRQDLLLPHTP